MYLQKCVQGHYTLICMVAATDCLLKHHCDESGWGRGPKFFRQIRLPVEELPLSSVLMVARLLNCPEARAGLPWSRSLGEGNSLCLGTGPFPPVSVKPEVKLSQEQDCKTVSRPCRTSLSSSDWPKVCLYEKWTLGGSVCCPACVSSPVSATQPLQSQSYASQVNSSPTVVSATPTFSLPSLALTWVKLQVFLCVLDPIWLSNGTQKIVNN